MEIIVTDLGLSGESLIRVNRSRKHQEALFLSDIVTAKGKRIERDYLRSWREAQKWSLRRHRTRYEYGPESPTKEDWDSWNKEISKLTTLNWTLFKPLGAWRATLHRIW